MSAFRPFLAALAFSIALLVDPTPIHASGVSPGEFDSIRNLIRSCHHDYRLGEDTSAIHDCTKLLCETQAIQADARKAIQAKSRGDLISGDDFILIFTFTRGMTTLSESLARVLYRTKDTMHGRKFAMLAINQLIYDAKNLHDLLIIARRTGRSPVKDGSVVLLRAALDEDSHMSSIMESIYPGIVEETLSSFQMTWTSSRFKSAINDCVQLRSACGSAPSSFNGSIPPSQIEGLLSVCASLLIN